jgi:phytoene dehydrogenase-like protein
VPVFEVDAVVVGGGHHGLVAAAVLADAGWDVLLLEAQPELGGAVRSTEWHPGFVADRFSAFYPLAAASPVLRALDLERHGLSWAHAPAVLAHPLRPDGTAAAVLHRDPERTAAALDAHHPGDGAAWLDLCRQWRAIEEPLLRSMFTTFPPVRGPAQLLRRIGAADALELLRFLLLPATRMGEERFGGAAARSADRGQRGATTDVPVTAPGSGLYGLVLAMVASTTGSPPRRRHGGAHRRSRPPGRVGRARCCAPASGWSRSRRRRARVGVVCADGMRVMVRRAVVPTCPRPTSTCGSCPARCPPACGRPARFAGTPPRSRSTGRWERRSRGVPRTSPRRARAPRRRRRRARALGADLETGALPSSPFLLLGQMTTTDPTRSPAGTESVWAYTHLPRG